MTFVSDDEAKAAKEIAKTGGKLIDAAAGIGAFMRQTLGTIPEDLIGIAGGDWLHQQRRRNLGKIEAKTEKLLEEVASDRISEPSVSVVVPLLEAAADEAREELQALWAALLANAMLDGGKRVRWVFFEIVRRLEPNDAVLFNIVGKHSDAGGLALQRIGQERPGAGIGPSEYEVAMDVLVDLKLVVVQANSQTPSLTALGRELLAMCQVAK